GGRPKGLVVSNGELQYNSPQWGDVMVGFNEDNILVIKDLNGMSVGQIEEMVKTERIRDCVSFKDIDDGDSNHFTKLIINGVATEINGSGSGANPRTCIGQRSDGTVLMFVTDGRGASGHIGATAADLISVMKEYGAVNAANIDGGSSSSMYYKGDYEMTSVTLYYSTSSWKLPTGFVVK
uniref:phosphodiester glycosidase family protein n=1 Tax=Eshraghiella crossota TaxID=45851 RepID=UPI0040251DA7